MNELVQKVSNGGVYSIISLILGILFFIYWVNLVNNRKYLKALLSLIIAFPFTFYASKFLGLTGWTEPNSQDPFVQKVGVSTLMILILFFSMFFHKSIKKQKTKEEKVTEVLLWLFCLTITISQLVNLTFPSSIILSIGASWQFLALFYIVISVLRDEKDVIKLLNAIFIFSLLNILVRVFAKGESFIMDLSDADTGFTNAGRVGSGSLGWAVSYAGYLAMFITLALGVYYITKKYMYLIYILIIIIELLNTFTRGGILILLTLLVLLFFNNYRKLFIKIVPFIFISLLPFYKTIWLYISLRTITLDVFNDENFTGRMLLINLYFTKYYNFSFWGNGIFKQTLINIGGSYHYLPVHNAYIEVLDVAGIFAFIIFVFLSLYLLWLAIKGNQKRNYFRDNRVSIKPFILIAILQWIIFANTTSTSILAYYPYEGTAVFWLLCFTALILFNVNRLKNI